MCTSYLMRIFSFVVVVQSFSHILLFAIPWTAARQDSLSFTISWSLFKSMSIESVMLSSDLIHCHLLLLLSSIFPNIRVFFQWVGFSCQVSKVLELQHQSFLWMFRVNFLYNWLIWSLCSWRDSQESSRTPQFKSTIKGFSMVMEAEVGVFL